MKPCGCLPLNMGICATSCILPVLQHGHFVMSTPVSLSIICSIEGVALISWEGDFSKSLIFFRLALRFLFAKNP